MAGMMMKVTCVMVACMVLSAPKTLAAISCGQVTANLAPCIQYLMGTVPQVPPPCCSGVKGLNNAASTTPDRKTACGCLKNAYPAFPGLKPELAAGLPGKCGVNIPYKISPNTDCNKIK